MDMRTSTDRCLYDSTTHVAVARDPRVELGKGSNCQSSSLSGIVPGWTKTSMIFLVKAEFSSGFQIQEMQLEIIN